MFIRAIDRILACHTETHLPTNHTHTHTHTHVKGGTISGYMTGAINSNSYMHHTVQHYEECTVCSTKYSTV